MDNSLTDAQANSVERVALSACKDSKEWISGVTANTLAIGFTTADQSTIESGLLTACLLLDKGNSTPVCADASKRGLLS